MLPAGLIVTPNPQPPQPLRGGRTQWENGRAGFQSWVYASPKPALLWLSPERGALPIGVKTPSGHTVVYCLSVLTAAIPGMPASDFWSLLSPDTHCYSRHCRHGFREVRKLAQSHTATRGLSEHWGMKTERTSFWSMCMDWGSGATSLYVKGLNPSSAPRYWVVSPGGSSGSVRGQWVTQGIGDGGRAGAVISWTCPARPPQEPSDIRPCVEAR